MRFKARLAENGFGQVPGRGYKETFLSTTSLPTIAHIEVMECVKTLSSNDIEITYLNADIYEEIFVHRLEGYEEYNEQGNPLV